MASDDRRYAFFSRLCGFPGILAVGVVVLDQLTKWLVQHYCEIGWNKAIVEGYFDLVHWRNTGAAWGIFAGRTWLLGVISLICLVVLLMRFDAWSGKRPLNACLFGLLAGGIAGNMLDRLFRSSVIDFLDFHWHDVYHYPAFNVADMAICVSVILLLICSFFEKPAPKCGEEGAASHEKEP